MVLTELHFDPHFLFNLSTSALYWGFSFVDFSFRNAVHISRFVWLDKENFGLIKVKDYDSVDRSIRVAVADDFEDFIGIKFEERG